MRLILCRHGDVFARGERAVWLGPHDDRPLAPEGGEQAGRLANALFRARIRPAGVFFGPPRRMRGHAEILARRLDLAKPPMLDARLADIDYGAWNGLSDEEIAVLCGQREFDDWRERNIWPPCSCWRSREDDFREAVRDFIDGVTRRYSANQTIVAVTGHGVLKCLGELMRRRTDGASLEAWRRVDAGNVCQLLYHGTRLHVVSWNGKPGTAQRSLD